MARDKSTRIFEENVSKTVQLPISYCFLAFFWADEPRNPDTVPGCAIERWPRVCLIDYNTDK